MIVISSLHRTCRLRKTTHKISTVYEIREKNYCIVKKLDTSFWKFNSSVLLRQSICRPRMTQQMSYHSSYNFLSSWDQSGFGMADVDGASIQGWFCFQMLYLLLNANLFTLYIFSCCNSYGLYNQYTNTSKQALNFSPKQNCTAGLSGRKSYLSEVYV